MNSPSKVCKNCGGEINSRVLGGQCPRCLLGLATQNSDPNLACADEPLAILHQGVLPHFGDYELESEIARGGMGVVYRARQKSLNRPVAVKLILAGQLATAQSILRFRTEAEAAAKLHHPNIVQVYEIGQWESQHYFSMQLIDGQSLAQCRDKWILSAFDSQNRHQAQRRIAALLTAVARGLHFAHQRGVLHCDLKPSNILIDEHGQPQITDFGLARLTGRESSGLTLSSAVLGTPGYLAPEQASGNQADITVAADVYGLGATLYELLTGRPPFVGSSAIATIYMAMSQRPAAPRTLNANIDRDLETICLRCLESAPSARYASAANVADDLQRFQAGQPIAARPITFTEVVLKWCRRNQLLTSILILLVMTFVGGSGLACWQWLRATQANVRLSSSLAQLQWREVDSMLARGHSSRALAKIAALLRREPEDRGAAMFAISALQQYRFPIPVAPPIRHPSGAEINVARLSRSGQRIVTASVDNTARVWDAASSLETVPALQHSAAVIWAEIDPHENWVATCSADRLLHMWQLSNGQRIAAPISLEDAPKRLMTDGEGKYLAVVMDHSVSIFTTADWQSLTKIPPTGTVIMARFTQGHLFAIARTLGSQTVVDVWDLEKNTCQSTFTGPAYSRVDLSEDTRKLAFVRLGEGGVLSYPDGQTLCKLSADMAGPINDIAISPNGDSVACQSFLRTVWIADAASGRDLGRTLEHAYNLNGMAFTDLDDDLLLTWANDALAMVWDVRNNRLYCEPLLHKQRVRHAQAIRRDQPLILTTLSHAKPNVAHRLSGEAQLWTLHSAQDLHSRTIQTDSSGHEACVMSDDGRTFATGTSSGMVNLYSQNGLAGSMKVSGGVWGLAFTHDSKRLAITTSTGKASIWDVERREPIAPPISIPAAFQPLAMAPNDQFFITGSTDHQVRCWNTSDGQVLWQANHGAEINAVAISPDSLTLASAGEDSRIKLWETRTGRPISELVGHENEVMSVQFDKSGQRIVSAAYDFTARLWDIKTGSQLTKMQHQGEVLDATFSNNDRWIATASRDRTAMIWDAASGLPRSPSLVLPQGCRTVRFSHDDSWLMTHDFNGLRFWDTHSFHPLTVHLPQRMISGTGFQTNSFRAQIAPDNSCVLAGGDCVEVRLWKLPPVASRVPSWFPDFLEAVAGLRIVPGTEQLEIVEKEEFIRLRDAVLSRRSDDAYSGWVMQWLGTR